MNNQRKKDISISAFERYCKANRINHFSVHIAAVPYENIIDTPAIYLPASVNGEFNEIHMILQPNTVMLLYKEKGKCIHSVSFHGVRRMQIKPGVIPNSGTLFLSCGLRDAEPTCKYGIDFWSAPLA